jgi:hypothetical protein
MKFHISIYISMKLEMETEGKITESLWLHVPMDLSGIWWRLIKNEEEEEEGKCRFGN